MRIGYIAVALIAVVTGASAIRTSVVGAAATAGPTGPAGRDRAIEGAANPLGGLIAPGAIHQRNAAGPAGLGTSFGAAKPPGNLVLAQTTSPANTGNPSLAPLKWVGMVKNPTPTNDQPGLYSYCTGQFITPKVVLTAAHCIKDLPDDPTTTGYDLSKETFLLQYQNGKSSQTFKTVCAATSAQYTLPSNYSTLNSNQKGIALLTLIQHDIAMILVDGTSPTGVMPYALDWKGKYTNAFSVGYVSDILDGQIVQQTPGYVFFADAIPILPQSFPNIVMHWSPNADFIPGGGAWVVNPTLNEASGKNILIAVSALELPAYPGSQTAAYLTAAEFNPLLAFVSNGCK